MEWGFCPDHKEDGTIAEDGHQVHEADRNRDPFMNMLQSRDSNQEEGGDLNFRGINSVHDESVEKHLFPDLKWHFQHRSIMHISLLSALLFET